MEITLEILPFKKTGPLCLQIGTASGFSSAKGDCFLTKVQPTFHRIKHDGMLNIWGALIISGVPSDSDIFYLGYHCIIIGINFISTFTSLTYNFLSWSCVNYPCEREQGTFIEAA